LGFFQKWTCLTKVAITTYPASIPSPAMES
jgi:hypothetical protein